MLFDSAPLQKLVGASSVKVDMPDECQPSPSDFFLVELNRYIEELRSELSDCDALAAYVDEHELPDKVIELLQKQLHATRYGSPERY